MFLLPYIQKLVWLHDRYSGFTEVTRIARYYHVRSKCQGRIMLQPVFKILERI